MNIETTSRFQPLSAKDFAKLGLPVMAYVKPVGEGAETAYGVFSADGQQMAVLANRDLAFAAARQNEFEPVSVH